MTSGSPIKVINAKFLLIFTICVGLLFLVYRGHYLGPPSVLLSPVPLFCDKEQFPFSGLCLCRPSVLEGGDVNEVLGSIDQLRLLKSRGAHCALTVNALGRLGNLMGEYATLYGLAHRNNRPAVVLPKMATVLQKYFNLTLPVIDQETQSKYLDKVWTPAHVKFWMEDSYAHFNDTFVLVVGYPYSWTYFHHLRDDILREFQFRPQVVAKAQKKLHSLRRDRPSATFVGVHARRGDYVELMKMPRYQGVVADRNFFRNATDYFRSRYADAIFVVVSDDMKWCRKNIDYSRGDVYFMGNTNTLNPIDDLALLANCNHSIITIGTFGFWAAYLAGGETVHLTNYCAPGAPFLERMKYEKLYLPNWIPIDANLPFNKSKT